jgi:outer membrane lipoprotein-sorting protein
LIIFAVFVSACGARHFTPPSGPATPFPDYPAVFAQATKECSGVKTLRATLSLSGRAGATKLRGRVDAGFAAPAEVRLEGRAPFGRPVFILVARNESNATLLLPRDNRVLRNAPAAAIVEALAGVALNPDELRSAIAGCGFTAGSPANGRSFGDWVAVDGADRAAHYLKRSDGRWRLLASVRGPLTLEYRDFTSIGPATVRMRADANAANERQSDLTVKLTDVELNVPLAADVFTVDVPRDADALTLDELRRAGPLGAASPR